MSVKAKGSEEIVPLEISPEKDTGWSLLLNHLAAKKEWQDLRPNSTIYLVLSRGETGPTVRFNQRQEGFRIRK